MPESLLLVSRNLPPLRGGMERLVYHAATELTRHWRVIVVGPRGCREHLPGEITVVEMPGTGLLSFMATAFPIALWLALRHQPRVLLAGSGLGAPVGRLVRWLTRTPYAILVHGLDLVANHSAYQRVFLPCIRAADGLVANSTHTAQLARSAGAAADRLWVVRPGVEYPPPEGEGSFRETSGAGTRTLLLSVGRLVRRKGLAPFIKHCLPALVRRFPDILLAIVGETPADALAAESDESVAISDAVLASGMAEHVLRCGHLQEGMIWSAYREADLFVFPCLEIPGDVEGFGMVALEAAAAGLPTAGFRAGGLVDAVIDQGTGVLVSPGRYDLLTEAVTALLAAGKAQYAESCHSHASALDWSRYGRELSFVLRQTAKLSRSGCMEAS